MTETVLAVGASTSLIPKHADTPSAWEHERAAQSHGHTAADCYGILPPLIHYSESESSGSLASRGVVDAYTHFFFSIHPCLTKRTRKGNRIPTGKMTSRTARERLLARYVQSPCSKLSPKQCNRSELCVPAHYGSAVICRLPPGAKKFLVREQFGPLLRDATAQPRTQVVRRVKGRRRLPYE